MELPVVWRRLSINLFAISTIYEKRGQIFGPLDEEQVIERENTAPKSLRVFTIEIPWVL